MLLCLHTVSRTRNWLKKFGRKTFWCFSFFKTFSRRIGEFDIRPVSERDAVRFFFGGKFLCEHCIDYLVKRLSGETVCKCFQIFPPKDLVYVVGEHFCSHF